MKDWQICIAILILIILINIKLKENLDLPERATAYDKPSELINEIQSIIKGDSNYDKTRYTNTKASSDILQNNRDSAYSINIRESGILDTCNTDLEHINNDIKLMTDATDLCNVALTDKNNRLNTCNASLSERIGEVNHMIQVIKNKWTHNTNLVNSINWLNSN
jgi:hypothetical protein